MKINKKSIKNKRKKAKMLAFFLFFLSKWWMVYYNNTMAESKKAEDIEKKLKTDEVKTEKKRKSSNFSAEKNSEKPENVVQEKEELEIAEMMQELGLEKEELDSNEELEVNKEYSEEKVKQVIELQNPKKKKKSTIINLCLLLVNLIFMIFIIKGLIANVGEVNLLDVVKAQGKKMWWLAGGLGIYIVYIVVQVLMYYVLIKDITGKKRLGLAYDVAIVGKYYDNVTPFAVGGQPMQIVRLTKNGVSAGTSTSIPIIKMMLNSFVNVILATLFFIFGVPKIPATSAFNNLLLTLLIILGVIGLIITIIIVLFTFLVGAGGLVTRSFISGIIRFGYKLGIVKNYRQTLKKVLDQVAEYKVSFRFMWKKKKMLVKMLILCVLECLSYAIMPYFVTRAFATSIGFSEGLFFIICISQYYICSMASCFLPLPGGTGLMEISFIFLFGLIVGDNIVWALLAWRILSYYMILVHGFTHELFHITKNIIKNKKRRELK